jgi:hypothetical protein
MVPVPSVCQNHLHIYFNDSGLLAIKMKTSAKKTTKKALRRAQRRRRRRNQKKNPFLLLHRPQLSQR